MKLDIKHKQYLLTIIAGLSVLASVFPVNYWISGIAALLYLSNVTYLAFLFAPWYLILIPVILWGTSGLPILIVLIGLPSLFMFYIIRKKSAARIKIRFSSITRSALSQFFIITVLLGSIYMAISVSTEDIKTFINKAIPENFVENISSRFMPQEIEIGGQTIDLSLDEESVIAYCQGNATCEALAREKLATSKKETENIAIDYLEVGLEQLEKFFGVGLPVISAVLVFLTLSPFAFIFASLVSFIAGLLFAILHISGFFKIGTRSVEQEYLS